MKQQQGNKYEARVSAKLAYEQSVPKTSYESRPLDGIFHGNALETAIAMEAQREAQECEMTTLDSDKPRIKKSNKPRPGAVAGRKGGKKGAKKVPINKRGKKQKKNKST
jgi:hypothetical protein